MLLACCGCRSTRDNQIDILERELRSQEDYIYELEDYVVQYSDKLRKLRAYRCADPPATVITTQPQPDSAKTNRPPSPTRSTTPHDRRQPTRADDAPDEPELEQPGDMIPEEMDIPELDIREPLGRRGEVDPFHQLSQASYVRKTAIPAKAGKPAEVLLIPDPAQFGQSGPSRLPEDAPVTTASTQAAAPTYSSAGPAEEEGASDMTTASVDQQPSASERTPERLVITHLLRNPGAVTESLLTVVEARDAHDEPVDLEGKVSLMVMTADPQSPQRLRRWNFTDEETAAAWQSSEMGDGLHLELPLEELQLPQQDLELWARMVAPDGQKLLTQIPFAVQDLLALGENTAAPDAPAALADGGKAAHPSELPLGKNASAPDGRFHSRQQQESMPLAEQSLAAATELPRNRSDAAKLDAPQLAEANEPRSVPARGPQKPRWRASRQQATDFAASHPTGWSAQPAGGRYPQPRQAVQTASLTEPSPPAPPTEKRPARAASQTWRPYR